MKLQVKKSPVVSERTLHVWDVYDEFGWRVIHLIQQDDKLMLIAYNKEGDEVTPNI